MSDSIQIQVADSHLYPGCAVRIAYLPEQARAAAAVVEFADGSGANATCHRRTLDELDRARHWMMLLGRKSASEKVASFLLEMSERLSGQGCQSGARDGFAATEGCVALSREDLEEVLRAAKPGDTLEIAAD